MNPASFAMEQPILREWAAQPLWIEVTKQAPSQRPTADFVSLKPVSAGAAHQVASSPAVVRFCSIPTLVQPDVKPGTVRLTLAPTSRPAVSAFALTSPMQENPASPWPFPRSSLGMPAAALAPHTPKIFGFAGPVAVLPRVRGPAAPAWKAPRSTCRTPVEVLSGPNIALAPVTPGFTACPWMPASAPRARRRPLASMSGTRRCLVSPPQPQIGPRCFGRPAPALGFGPPVPVKVPPPKAAPAPVRNSAGTLVWKFRVRLGPHARVIPVRPRFEDPLPVALSLPREPEPLPSLWKKLTARWSAVPLWVRQVAAVVVLAALALSSYVYLKSSPAMQKANTELVAHIQRRAAIDIQDDFRAGLSQWTGPPGWSNTWTYDATGFARPGRLALLADSAPLSDYHLEFLAEIDRKAVAWVFRATDARNYYACKLVESKRDAVTAYSIVRYAVIDGRERLRIQLPLPITATAKSMFRVRQEIRGDQFTTYLDGHVIDTWSDTSLARGGFGFFADPGETAYIRWVDVAYQDDAWGRICAYLVPGKHN